MAAPTTWVYTTVGDRPVISNNDVYVPLWVPGEPELVPFTPGLMYDQSAIRMSATMPGPLVASILGNEYIDGSVFIQSPSLYGPDGLRLEHTILEGSGGESEWVLPTQDFGTGYVRAAVLEQAGPVGDFDLSTFAYGVDEFAYVGFADATLTRFGYLQMERASATDVTQWRLVGYAYEEVGVAIDVVDLTTVPGAATLAVLGTGASLMGRSRRRYGAAGGTGFHPSRSHTPDGRGTEVGRSGPSSVCEQRVSRSNSRQGPRPRGLKSAAPRSDAAGLGD